MEIDIEEMAFNKYTIVDNADFLKLCNVDYMSSIDNLISKNEKVVFDELLKCIQILFNSEGTLKNNVSPKVFVYFLEENKNSSIKFPEETIDKAVSEMRNKGILNNDEALSETDIIILVSNIANYLGIKDMDYSLNNLVEFIKFLIFIIKNASLFSDSMQYQVKCVTYLNFAFKYLKDNSFIIFNNPTAFQNIKNFLKNASINVDYLKYLNIEGVEKMQSLNEFREKISKTPFKDFETDFWKAFYNAIRNDNSIQFILKNADKVPSNLINDSKKDEVHTKK